MIEEEKAVKFIPAVWIYIFILCFFFWNACFFINFIRAKRQVVTGDKLDWEHLDRTWLYFYWFIRVRTETLEIFFQWCIQNIWPSIENNFWFLVKIIKLRPVIFCTGVKRKVLEFPIARFVLDIVSCNHSDVLWVIFRLSICTHGSNCKDLIWILQIDTKFFVKVVSDDILVDIWVSSANQVISLRDGVT